MSGNVQKVAVLGSSTKTEDSFIGDARRLGEMLAEQGLHIILPGEMEGPLGDVMTGALGKGGKIVNVYTNPYEAPNIEHASSDYDEMMESVSVIGRKGVKKSLDTRADVAVLLMGGLEELDEVTHLIRRGMPVIIVNEENIYDGLEEQLGDLKQNRLIHNFPGNHMEHVHVVEYVEEAAPIIDSYNTEGSPEYDYAARWNMAKLEERIVRMEREGKEPGFTTRGGKNKLVDDAGIIALDRATTALLEDKNTPMIIDNSQGYYDGLLAQLRAFVDNGYEKPMALKHVGVIEKGAETVTPFLRPEDGPAYSEHAL